MSADEHLTRAAERLRDPYRCNTDPVVDRAVADWLHRVIALQQIRDGGGIEPPFIGEALAVARAVLRDRDPDTAMEELRRTLREGGKPAEGEPVADPPHGLDPGQVC